jgi:RimJ/RimL family protein N-acetyltransferase
MMAPQLETDRLILRHWREEDLPAWIAMNADPEVMEFFPKLLTQDESIAMAERLQTRLENEAFGLWAVEAKGGEPFIGFVGLSIQDVGLSICPCVEVGWRLKKSAWGKGFASEAARESLRFGFEECDIQDIYSFTTKTNLKSQAVMKRIGMAERPDLAFNHPRIDAASPLASHVTHWLGKNKAN